MHEDDVVGVLDRLDAAGVEWASGRRDVRCLSVKFQLANARRGDVAALRERLCR